MAASLENILKTPPDFVGFSVTAVAADETEGAGGSAAVSHDGALGSDIIFLNTRNSFLDEKLAFYTVKLVEALMYRLHTMRASITSKLRSGSMKLLNSNFVDGDRVSSILDF